MAGLIRALTRGAVCLGVAGCAGARMAPVAPVTPVELEELEADLVRHASDADEITRIGIRFYDAGRYTRAADVLGAAVLLRSDAFPALVYRGLSFEALARYDSAQTVYAAAAHLRLNGAQRRELEGRRSLLARRQLAVDIRRAVARESTIAAAPPPANSIAVLPWLYVGDNEELRALERGMAHLLVTDLAKVSRIQLLERERVQALVDELQLTAGGRVDPSTGARSGRILGAAHVVQGSLREQGGSGVLELEASVVNTADAKVDGSRRFRDRLQDLFTMEKQIVFEVLDQLGINPTPAELRAISERPTADLQAFLAFSRGLEAQDRGDPLTASGYYSSAAIRDPGFRVARERALAADRQAAAEVSSAPLVAVANPVPGEGETGLLGTILRGVQVVAPSAGSAIDQRGGAPPVTKPRLPEALQQDNPSRITIFGDIIIVIPRP